MYAEVTQKSKNHTETIVHYGIIDRAALLSTTVTFIIKVVFKSTTVSYLRRYYL